MLLAHFKTSKLHLNMITIEQNTAICSLLVIVALKRHKYHVSLQKHLVVWKKAGFTWELLNKNEAELHLSQHECKNPIYYCILIL